MTIRSLSLLLTVLCTSSFAEDKLSDWYVGLVTVDEFCVEYTFPRRTGFSHPPESSVALDGRKYVRVAVMSFNPSRLAFWRSSEIFYSVYFWNARLDFGVESTSELYQFFEDNKEREGYRFRKIELRSMANGDWVYVLSDIREAYYQYHADGYFVEINAHYFSTKPEVRAKFSDELKVAAENYKIERCDKGSDTDNNQDTHSKK